MSTVRRIAALSIVGAALTFAAIGIVRGTLPAGPGSGTRFVVAIAPPVDDAAMTVASHVVRERLDEKGAEEVRVLAAGDKLVVEIGTTDPELVGMEAKLLERTGKLEVHRVDASSAPFAGAQTAAGVRIENGIPVADDRGALAAALAQVTAPADRLIATGHVGDTRTWRPYLLDRAVLLEGTQIRRADVLAGGVAITVATPSALAGVTVGAPIAVMFDGVVHFVGTPDRIEGTLLHVPTGASVIAASELVTVVEAGAVHPLRVVDQKAFTRATGFLPRAWPFFAIGGALLIVAALLWWSGRPKKP